MTAVKYRADAVDGLNIFFREAGAADAGNLLLLHGFPSAGHMFRDLIPLLADRFRVIAPDTILAHPTMAEGLNSLFAAIPGALR